ncbi:MAG: hypothetical protein CVU23_04925, partial [Betaproteobacteria bacterium HGW-Betaproteobacteria-17]
MTRPPIAALKTSILLLLAASVLSAVGIFWSHQQDADARAELQGQQVALRAAHARQQQGQTEARLIAQ